MTRRPSDDDELLRARSYDDVADAYERVNAPLFFDVPARALVEIVGLEPGERVLDAGTGTGAVARAALAVAGSPDSIVAIDPSTAMLMAARRARIQLVVAGAMPDLPFSDSSFDVVLSAFVMTHVDDPDAAIRDVLRVLRPGGRVALSAWSPSDDEYSRAWSEVVHEFVAADALARAAERVLPGEPRFSRRDGLAALLEANGFRGARTETRSFRFALTIDEMAETREVCASGRALRALLPDAEWQEYQTRVRSVLGNKFPQGIRYDRAVYFAVGRRS
jgi:ubiquinone/menaquinone biosynthesis C-methylase UbiE